MSVVDDYLQKLSDSERRVIEPMYTQIRELVPDSTEELSYAMPAFKYKGKGLASIISNKNFYSLYPFCAVDRLGLDLSNFECSSGSIHFTADKPISPELLKQIIESRLNLITK